MDLSQLFALIFVVTLPFILIIFLVKTQFVKTSNTIQGWAEAIGDEIILGPEDAHFRGSTIDRWNRARGSGIAILTNHRLVYENQVVKGRNVEVPLDAVMSVSTETKYPLSFMWQYPMIILHLRNGGKVEFLIKDGDKWLQAIENAIRQE